MNTEEPVSVVISPSCLHLKSALKCQIVLKIQKTNGQSEEKYLRHLELTEV